MRILNFLLMAAFLLSAAVQYNDPDPLPWMLVYSAAALCCVLFALDRLPVYVPVLVGTAALIWAGLLLPRVMAGQGEWSLGAVFGSVAMKSERVELTREIGGLLIVDMWMFVLVFAGMRKNRVESS